MLVNNISISRGPSWSLEKVQFNLRKGELLTLCGANGSGKSTLLRIMAGLIEPDEGEVTTLSGDASFPIMKAYLGHRDGLKDVLTPIETLMFETSLCSYHTLNAPLAHQCLHQWGLEKKHHAKPLASLSFGQRRRVAFALLESKMAAIWLLDEPWVGLDETGKSILSKAIQSHINLGGTVVVTQHEAPSQGSYYQLPEKSYVAECV